MDSPDALMTLIDLISFVSFQVASRFLFFLEMRLYTARLFHSFELKVDLTFHFLVELVKIKITKSDTVRYKNHIEIGNTRKVIRITTTDCPKSIESTIQAEI